MGLLKGAARMVVDFNQAKETGDLDNLVEFIEGKKEEKTLRKKKKGKTQTKDKLNKLQNLCEASQADESEVYQEQNPESPINLQKPKNMLVEVIEDKTEVSVE